MKLLISIFLLFFSGYTIAADDSSSLSINTILEMIRGGTVSFADIERAKTERQAAGETASSSSSLSSLSSSFSDEDEEGEARKPKRKAGEAGLQALLKDAKRRGSDSPQRKKRAVVQRDLYLAGSASSKSSSQTEALQAQKQEALLSSEEKHKKRGREEEKQTSDSRDLRSDLPRAAKSSRSEMVSQDLLYVKDLGADIGRGLFCKKPIRKGQIISFYGGKYLSKEISDKKLEEDAEETYYYFEISNEGNIEAVINGWSADISKDKTVAEINQNKSLKIAGSGDREYMMKGPSLGSFANHRDLWDDDMFLGFLSKEQILCLRQLLKDKAFLKETAVESTRDKIEYIEGAEADLLGLDLDKVTPSREEQIVILTNILMMNGFNADFSRERVVEEISIEGHTQKKSQHIVKIKAIRDIPANEEIIINYGPKYREVIWEFSGEKLRKKIVAVPRFSSAGFLKKDSYTPCQLHDFSYKSLEEVKIKTKLPYDALVIIYFSLLYQEKIEPTAPDLISVIKGKYFEPSFDLRQDINLCIDNCSCFEGKKEELKLLFAGLEKDTFGEESELDSIVEDAISFFVENFDFFRPYHDVTSVSKNCNYFNKKRVNYGTMIADLLMLRFIDHKDPTKDLVWPLSEKLTKDLIKKIKESKEKDYEKWLSGSDKTIGLSDLVQVTKTTNKAFQLQEKLRENNVIDYDYTFEFERDFSDRKIIRNIKKACVLELDSCYHDDEKTNEVLKKIYLDSFKSEDQTLKSRLAGVFSQIEGSRPSQSFIALTKSVQKSLVEAKLNASCKSIELVLRILFYKGYRVDFVSGNSIIGLLEEEGLSHISSVLILDTSVKLRKSLFLFKNRITGKTPIHYVFEWGLTSAVLQELEECCGKSLDPVIMGENLGDQSLRDHEGFPALFTASSHCPESFEQLLKKNKNYARVLGPNSSNLLYGILNFNSSDRNSAKQKELIEKMIRALRVSLSPADFLSFTEPDGENAKTTEVEDENMYPAGKIIYDLIEDSVTEDQLNKYLVVGSDSFEEERRLSKEIYAALKTDNIIQHSLITDRVVVSFFDKSVIEKVSAISKRLGVEVQEQESYCEYTLNCLWDAHRQHIFRSVLEEEYSKAKEAKVKTRGDEHTFAFEPEEPDSAKSVSRGEASDREETPQPTGMLIPSPGGSCEEEAFPLSCSNKEGEGGVLSQEPQAAAASVNQEKSALGAGISAVDRQAAALSSAETHVFCAVATQIVRDYALAASSSSASFSSAAATDPGAVDEATAAPSWLLPQEALTSSVKEASFAPSADPRRQSDLVSKEPSLFPLALKAQAESGSLPPQQQSSAEEAQEDDSLIDPSLILPANSGAAEEQGAASSSATSMESQQEEPLPEDVVSISDDSDSEDSEVEFLSVKKNNFVDLS